MHGRWGEVPFVALTLCLTAGICVSLPIHRYSFEGLAAGALALIAGAWFAHKRNRVTPALVLSLSAVGITGLMLALVRRDAYPELDLRARLARREIPLDDLVPFDGCVAEEAQRHAGEIVTTVDLHALRNRESWIPCRGKGTLRIPGDAAESGGDPGTRLHQGDRLRGWASWQVPRNYQNPGASDHVAFLQRRGIFLQGRVKSSRLLEIIPGDCLDSWTAMAVGARRRVQKNLLELTGPDREREAAILAALVIGDYSELGPDIRQAFQNSGTYHVLVVSGLHVAWIAWVLVGLFRIVHIPQGIGRVSAAASILFYTSVVGFQASISRSLWTFLIYLLGQVLFRRAPPTNIALASAFLLLTGRPDWIFDAGFQLSFLSVLSICVMGAPVIDRVVRPVFDPPAHSGQADRMFLQWGGIHRSGRRVRVRCELLAEAVADRWHPAFGRALLFVSRRTARACGLVAGMLTISVSVQLWLEPLLAYHFNRLSWIAPVANLVVVPLSSLALAAGLLSALVSNLPCIAPALLTLAGRLSMLLLNSATTISGLPGAWQRCPTPALEWVLAGIMFVFAACFLNWRRKWASWLLVASVLVCLSCGLTPLDALPPSWVAGLGKGNGYGMTPAAVLSLTFLDVGEGDSLVIRFPDSRIWVLDAGGLRQGRSSIESAQGFDVGEAVVSRYLWSQWITKIDRLLLSHPDIDHAGGMPALLKNFSVSRLEYGANVTDPLLTRVLTAAREKKIPSAHMQAGDSFVISGVRVEAINPLADGMPRSTNEASVVLRLCYGRFSALLTGDLEKTGEEEVLGRGQDLRSPLLKVAHHGSRWATSESFLARVRPGWAIISVGRNNPFGHPSPEVLARLLHHRAVPILTLDQGAVTFATDGVRFVISSHVSGILRSDQLPQPRDIRPRVAPEG